VQLTPRRGRDLPELVAQAANDGRGLDYAFDGRGCLIQNQSR
jgi:hypothetical protein